MLTTNIKKRTLTKLLKDCCIKTALSFNNVIYEQIDGVWKWIPNYVNKPLLRLLKSNSAILLIKNSIKKNDIPEIIFGLPYAGKVDEQASKRYLKRVKCCLNSNVKFRVLHDTKKMLFYGDIKDKVGNAQRNHIIYKIKYPGCNDCYIGKTKRCIITRITEHDTKETETMFKHLSECEMFKDCFWLYSLSSLFSEYEHNDIFLTSYIFNAILQNP